MNASQVKDYASAAEYLGRKSDRPLANNTRLERLSADSIGVRLHGTYVVTYHADGTETLCTGGWWTVTTKDRINRFSSARVGSDRGTWYVSHPSDPVSAPRIQKCRTCKGQGWTQDPPYLTGAGWDLPSYRRLEGPANRIVPEPRQCYRCGGEGRKDYGSNPIPTPWEGGELTIRDGQVI